MDRSFWESSWREHRIGFHRQEVNPNLVRHVSSWLSPVQARERSAQEPGFLDGVRVLVPLCGKSVDMLWLVQHGAHVVGVEFVEQAAHEFFEQLQVAPKLNVEPFGLRFSLSEPLGAGTSSGSLELLVTDFFSLTPEMLGPIDAIYDRAALVAVQPERRAAYAKQLERLARPGTKMLLVSFEHDGGSGPPFSVPPHEVRTLLEPVFEGTLVADDDILESEPRFRDRGITRLHEQVWLFTRG